MLFCALNHFLLEGSELEFRAYKPLANWVALHASVNSKDIIGKSVRKMTFVPNKTLDGHFRAARLQLYDITDIHSHTSRTRLNFDVN
jgi:hypothetical protein